MLPYVPLKYTHTHTHTTIYPLCIYFFPISYLTSTFDQGLLWILSHGLEPYALIWMVLWFLIEIAWRVSLWLLMKFISCLLMVVFPSWFTCDCSHWCKEWILIFDSSLVYLSILNDEVLWCPLLLKDFLFILLLPFVFCMSFLIDLIEVLTMQWLNEDGGWRRGFGWRKTREAH